VLGPKEGEAPDEGSKKIRVPAVKKKDSKEPSDKKTWKGVSSESPLIILTRTRKEKNTRKRKRGQNVSTLAIPPRGDKKKGEGDLGGLVRI